MLSSQSSAPVMQRSRYYNFVDVIGSLDLLRYAELRASRTRVRALFLLARLQGLRRHKRKVVIGIAPRLRPFGSVKPFLAMIAKEVFYHSILQRMESDHRDASGPLESRSRFFAQLAKQTGQFLFAVIVYDCRGGEARSRVHPHVKRTVSHQTEPALRVFELPGRNT